MKLSVLIVAHNEEARLPGCIEQARHYADEIVVVVGQSMDATLSQAIELADVVLEHPPLGCAEFSRGAGIRACSGDWVLVLDADEHLTEYGETIIRPLLERTERARFLLRRLTTVDGAPLEDAYHSRLIRPQYWDGVSNVIHSDVRGLPGVADIKVDGAPAIAHFKTTAEQHAADLKMVQRGYLTEGHRPEGDVVPWEIRHK